jgi:hypothetical protein
MKRIPILVVMLFAASLAVGQDAVEHAPTIEQCRADRNTWMSQRLESDSPTSPTIDVLSMQVLEMEKCRLSIDYEGAFSYRAAEGLITMTMFTREAHFIKRHGLADQFAAEDAQGKR